MQTRRLGFLLELSRLGSMSAVANALGTTTSTVSQQIAALSADVGSRLVEPDGRRVRLTPEGRRLAAHAATILAAVEAALVDLDPAAEPAGTVRIAGFASAIRRSLLPVMARLAAERPTVRLLVHEHEPAEALALLADDDVDLALVYDYDLAPRAPDPGNVSTPLWSAAWGLGVPDSCAPARHADSLSTFRTLRDADWIVNSRNAADERVVRTIASMAGFEPRIAHQADSLELVQGLIVAGFGVGLLPAEASPVPRVRLVPLHRPDVTQRAYALTRSGRARWPPLELIVGLLPERAGPDPA